ncbi:MAG: hypothetical protein AAFO95_22405, partial [Cyanobacteria bacterium J06600_6]
EAAAAGQKIMAANGATQAVLKSVTSPQLEGKDFSPVSQSLRPSNSHSSTSINKYKQVPPSPDPWSEGEQPNLREMLAQRKIKGFAKAMPQVSQAEIEAEERKQIKPKTNIAAMSLAEINDYLKDPILRAQLTPQLIDSDYELITDELGQIIRIELSELQIRERRRLKRELL